MDYDELVQKNIAGEISDLEFLLAQEELAQAYQEEMVAKQQETNNQTAREWLLDYENRKFASRNAPASTRLWCLPSRNDVIRTVPAEQMKLTIWGIVQNCG